MNKITKILSTSALALTMALSVNALPLSDYHKNETADIVDTAVSAGQFSTLIAAVKAAGLEETLRGDGPYTIFAPTDEAFSQLPEGTIADLLKPENKEKLTQILTYHVVPGKIMSSDLAGKKLDANTASGQDLEIDASGDGVLVGGANVIKADIKTSNGVIHVIDRVLLP